jgi:ELWxxDGT repeat protein
MKTKNYILLCTLLFLQNFIAQEISLIKDISTDLFVKSSNPRYFTEFNNKIYFSADDQVNGRELWVSDGTTNGTYLLKDINDGQNGSSPNRFIAYNNELFFTCDTNEIWKTDGTENGTVLVANLGSDTTFGHNTQFTEFNGKLYFSGDSIADDAELWVTNGTQNGTYMLKDINLLESNASNPNILSQGSNPSFFTVYNNKLYFSADDGINGIELWETDGTEQGTILSIDIDPGSEDASPSSLIVFKNKLFFAAGGDDNGTELWSSDGTLNGTELIKDINTGDSNSVPGFTDAVSTGGTRSGEMVILNDELYFTANVDYSSSNATGIELWKTDGSTAGTVIVKDIIEGSTGSNPVYLTAFADKIYFSAITGFSNGLRLKYLWETDGTEVGTIEVKDVNNNSI